MDGNIDGIVGGKFSTAGQTAQTLTSKFVGIKVNIAKGDNRGAGLSPDEVRDPAGAPYTASNDDAKGIIVEFVSIATPDGESTYNAIVELEQEIQATSLDEEGAAGSVSVNYLSVPVENVAPDKSFYEDLYGKTEPAEKKNDSTTNTTLGTLTALTENFGDAKSYLAPNNSNSLVRSFEAAGGRGIACAITSLEYTWYDDNTLWETDQGKRAPMSCKVSMQIAPIHDIPMGLDADGFPRAVPYPVGDLVRSTFFPELSNNDEKEVRPRIDKLSADGKRNK